MKDQQAIAGNVRDNLACVLLVGAPMSDLEARPKVAGREKEHITRVASRVRNGKRENVRGKHASLCRSC